METIKILAYSDSKYEYQVDSLIQSLRLRGHGNIEFIYYTVGFDSKLEYENLIKKYWPIDKTLSRFPYYKPGICLDAIKNFGGNIVFMDSDIIVGKRFNPDFFIHDREYPILSIGNWEMPYYFIPMDFSKEFPVFNLGDRILLKNSPDFGNVIDYDHKRERYLAKLDNYETPRFYHKSDLAECRINDHHKLMSYYGIKKPTMTYVYSCFLSFNEKCTDFIEEWKSITENPYLNKYDREYYPIAEETAINVLLWKRNVKENYGRIFVNTLFSDVILYTEEREDITETNIFGNDLQKCENSKEVKFYHGMINPEEIEKTINHIKKIH